MAARGASLRAPDLHLDADQSAVIAKGAGELVHANPDASKPADGEPAAIPRTLIGRTTLVWNKGMRFDKDLVAEVGGDPEELSPRDRQRFWYAAITLARPDSTEAQAQADRLAGAVKPLGYLVGPPPSPGGKPAPAPEPGPKPTEVEKPKKKK